MELVLNDAHFVCGGLVSEYAMKTIWFWNCTVVLHANYIDIQ